MKRTVNFNGVIPGPMLKANPGDIIEIDFYNEIDDLGELETWNDGMMQRHTMLHMHLDDRVYVPIQPLQLRRQLTLVLGKHLPDRVIQP